MSPLRKQGSKAKNWIPAFAGMTESGNQQSIKGLLKKPRLLRHYIPRNDAKCVFMSLRAIRRIARQSQNVHLELWQQALNRIVITLTHWKYQIILITAFSSYSLGHLHIVHIDFLKVGMFEVLFLPNGNQTSLLHNAHPVCYELGSEYIMGSHQNGFALLP